MTTLNLILGLTAYLLTGFLTLCHAKRLNRPVSKHEWIMFAALWWLWWFLSFLDWLSDGGINNLADRVIGRGKE